MNHSSIQNNPLKEVRKFSELQCHRDNQMELGKQLQEQNYKNKNKRSSTKIQHKKNNEC